MLSERRANAFRYDVATDTVTVGVGSPSSPARDAAVSVTMLLDAKGFLVGVDLGGLGFGRTVVMLGRHEDVATTKGAKVTVTHGADGEVARIAIGQARTTIRGAEKSPYVG